MSNTHGWGNAAQLGNTGNTHTVAVVRATRQQETGRQVLTSPRWRSCSVIASLIPDLSFATLFSILLSFPFISSRLIFSSLYPSWALSLLLYYPYFLYLAIPLSQCSVFCSSSTLCVEALIPSLISTGNNSHWQ